jgi:ribulose-phosphate 3-epimerase
MSRLVSPSLLAANFLHLDTEIEMINKSQADWLHLDIMDGVFVPNISYGIPILESIKPILQKPMDVHLMIVDPDRYVEAFRKAGAEILTVHYEACPHLHRTIQHIKDNGMKAGVSLNPHTPVSLLENVLEDIDVVLLMTVNPGFGGQKFIEKSFKKVAELRKMIDSRGAATLIQIDGGVDTTNAKALYDAGADCLVAGSAVFKSKDPLLTITALKNA